MPIHLVRVLGFDGPNIYGPQPGVLLQVRSDQDRSALLRALLKDGAQRVGMVLGYLDMSVVPHDDAHLITASFVTPTPAIGVELARHAVAAIAAHERGDETYDFDEQLWDLQKRRRAEALPIAALQIVAEAARRGLPAFVRADGRLQLGYGARGWAVDMAAMRGDTMRMPDAMRSGAPLFDAHAVAVPWEQIGTIPILALSGGELADEAAHALAAALHGDGETVGLALAAGFDAARALLADAALTCAVLSLDAGDLLRRGLPFEQCAMSAVVAMPEPLPPDAASRVELARALGLPMLASAPDGVALLNMAVPELAALAEYAPCRVLPLDMAGDVAAAVVRAWRGH
jgi:hypothetical protein